MLIPVVSPNAKKDTKVIMMHHMTKKVCYTSFDCFHLRNAVVSLMMPVVSYDVKDNTVGIM